MRFVGDKYSFRILVYVAIGLLFLTPADAQKILGYGPEELTASIHYNEFLYGIYKNYYQKLPDYPVKGVYSPTGYSSSALSIAPGVGECNYIYIPTHGALLPGHQYRISLTVKVGKAYEQMPYFQEHLGIALSSDLFKKNYFGLWSKHFVPLGMLKTEELVSVDFIFRPLCTSKYLVLGVFQGSEMDHLIGFAEQYGFELHHLLVEKYDDPHADFVYMCDVFEEERLEKLFSTGYDTDTVYFDSGSSEIQDKYLSVLDSVPSKLRTKQDLVTLYAYTDIAGSENDSLGAARNAAVREALLWRGLDSARILMVNYGESKASARISQEDRRVEIDINRGKLFQKYYTEALQAAAREDYRGAQARMTHWIKMVPPENAIYALFDCWGQGEKANIFKGDLAKSIRSRHYYKGKDLKFTFDSLFCEDQKGRTLSMYLRSNRLPDFSNNCTHESDSLHEANHHSIVDRLYAAYGFPPVADVGERGNKVLPYMILHTTDTLFQNRYLPLIQKACEEQLISWEYYAMLFDKINIIRNGHQRYGTQYVLEEGRVLSGLYPFEEEDKVAEYRKQVGLVPLSDF
jgi:hypothetical protein